MQSKRSRTTADVTKPREPKAMTDQGEHDAASVRIVDGRKQKRRTVLWSFIIFFIIVGGVLFLSHLLSGVELTVNPRFREPNVNATLTASRTPQADELTYEIMSLEATGERQVSATGEETVVEQAQGTILVYNRHTTDTVRLITNTRFEAPEGKIFRLRESIVVPGYTRGDAGEIAPGVITATVFADQPGEEYNIGPSRFTIPGFADSPEFENLYAESVESMGGGFNGTRFIVDEAELQTAQQSLQMELRNSLLARVDSEKPAGFNVFPGAITFTYETMPAVEYGDNLATIKEKATLRIPIFEDTTFASYLAAATIPGYEAAPVRIEDPTALTFDYTNATTSISNIAAAETLEFTLVGRPLIVWEYDAEALKKDLAGKNKTALTAVLGGYPAIERADAQTQPVWSNSFPENPDDIKIVEVLERQ